MAVPLHNSTTGQLHVTVPCAFDRATRFGQVLLGSDWNECRASAGADELTSDRSMAADVSDGGTYSEEAFRYLLAIERKRAERCGRPFLLLLVDYRRLGADICRLVGRAPGNRLHGMVSSESNCRCRAAAVDGRSGRQHQRNRQGARSGAAPFAITYRRGSSTAAARV